MASPSGASIAIAKVTEMAFALVSTFEILMPGMKPKTAPAKLLPVRTTVWLAPWLALAGLMLSTDGRVDAPVTWNTKVLLTPFAVVTVTFRGPGAAPAVTAKVAVIVVAVATTLPKVRPAPVTLIVPPLKFPPAIVTGPLVPTPALDGVMEKRNG